jgi:excisionase family DNA binding protein
MMRQQPEMIPDLRRTLNIEEAAMVLGIGRRLAYELARRGELPGVMKLGGRYVISKAALERFLQGADVGKQPVA